MQTLTAHNALEPEPACSMPEHGREDAPHACCRPSSPAFKPAVAAAPVPRRAGFWRDRQVWKVAARNTFNCLIGCSIGDFGVLIYTQIHHAHLPMWHRMALGMAAGLLTSIALETTILRYRERFAWKAALAMALSMSFLSMLGMELAENATDYFLTGGMVPVSNPFYWIALGISLAAGFLVPLPYNYWKFKKHGKACH